MFYSLCLELVHGMHSVMRQHKVMPVILHVPTGVYTCICVYCTVRYMYMYIQTSHVCVCVCVCVYVCVCVCKLQTVCV